MIPSQSKDENLKILGDKIQTQEKENIVENNLIPTSTWGEDIKISRKSLIANLQDIQKDIAHCKVKIVAVTKYFGLDSILAGYEVGLRDFGESRANDAIKKIECLPKEIRENSTFHFIGHLQSNKAERVVEHFDIIESVDSLKIAKAISKAACRLNKREKVLLQVNNAGEEQKSGFSKEQLREDFKEIMSLDNIEIIGLMNIAPIEIEDNTLKDLFSDIREFRNELSESFKVALPELSMGMSNDYKIALSEGATIIRIGRKLFK